MAIRDPYMNSNNSNYSPTAVARNTTPNTSFSNHEMTNNMFNPNMHMHNGNGNGNVNGNSESDNMNRNFSFGNGNSHSTRNMNINSSPLPSTYQANRQRLMNTATSSPLRVSSPSPSSNLRCKRRSSEDENTMKKTKHFTGNNAQAIPTDQLNLDNINLEEYPKFNHPDGGIIQFTPIGNIRTFISDNNVVNRIIEQNSTFDLNQTDRGIDGYKIYLGNVSMNPSPSNEIETYMINGYSESKPSFVSSAPYGGNFDYDCDSDLDEDDYMS